MVNTAAQLFEVISFFLMTPSILVTILGRRRLEFVAGFLWKTAMYITDFNAKALYLLRIFNPSDLPYANKITTREVVFDSATEKSPRNRAIFKRRFRQFLNYYIIILHLGVDYRLELISKGEFWREVVIKWPPIYLQSSKFRQLIFEKYLPMVLGERSPFSVIVDFLRGKTSVTDYFHSTYPVILRALYHDFIFLIGVWIIVANFSSEKLSSFSFLPLIHVFLGIVLGIILAFVLLILFVYAIFHYSQVIWRNLFPEQTNIFSYFESLILLLLRIIIKLLDYLNNEVFSDRNLIRAMSIGVGGLGNYLYDYQDVLVRSPKKALNIYTTRLLILLLTNYVIAIFLTFYVEDGFLIINLLLILIGLIGVFLHFPAAIIYSILSILIPLGFVSNITLDLLEKREKLITFLFLLGAFFFLFSKALAIYGG